ncbi:MGH1-like glycoside hydrolase domain-containing protein [Olivibacter sitiensis]|uniref:MGH1-like glycoside hydrolase domain-containing protein n=1 Tax=Olivibacter sitiensis TaxID=376470 RepID=UPI0003F59F9E|nr:glycogen debranching protein [Olivibacter sitiensis]
MYILPKNSILKYLPLIGTLACMQACQVNNQETSKLVTTYKVADNKVVQGDYMAEALSPTKLRSNYKSLATLYKSPELTFKFAINGRDNEMPSGSDHRLVLLPDTDGSEVSLIKFGEAYVDKSEVPSDVYLKRNTPVHIRLDMRHVLASFDEKGYYESYNGNKLYKEDFKGVYMAGSSAPLIWDFDNLVNHPDLQLHDKDGDGIYELDLVLNAEEEQAEDRLWELSTNLDAYPKYQSDHVLSDALYNLSLEEMTKDIEADSTFRTGKEWSGVWTRDISYSIILSMAALQPEVAKKSLMRKVQNQRIIQDTGTGGAYPVSTDRMIWAVAAMEVYKVTGDEAWLRQVYPIIKNSLEDDFRNAYDMERGLVRGESSFLDWREQTYPKWMEPKDIFVSENLGTTAVHYQGNKVLAEMAELLGDKTAGDRYSDMADKLKAGMVKYLWMDDKGYFGQYLYGQNYLSLSPRAEALGEALSVLFDIADSEQQESIVAHTPVIDFGIPCIFPQIPGIPPYHNDGIWPFVQAYWALAAAKVGNEASLVHSINAIYRPAALFLTNKENFVASNGDYAGTQINSSEMLWSISGNLALVYKVLFGMQFRHDGLYFSPFVPKVYGGEHRLSNFKYRNAVLDIELTGHGNQIKSFLLDGKEQQDALLPANLRGAHRIKIVLANNDTGNKAINLIANQTSLPDPKTQLKGNQLTWDKVAGAIAYQVVQNGQALTKQTETSYSIDTANYGAYQVIALDSAGNGSFAGKPFIYSPRSDIQRLDMAAILPPDQQYAAKGAEGKGYITINHKRHRTINIPVVVGKSGTYAIDFRYANGHGPVNTENKCAIRTLQANGQFAGTFVFPQRGKAEWSNWGYSNAVQVKLNEGANILILSFEQPVNDNMNLAVNEALLDEVRLIRLD